MEEIIQLDKQTELKVDNSFLFNQVNQKEFYEALVDGLVLLQNKIQTVSKPFSGILPGDLAMEFKDVNLNQPLNSIKEALKEVEKLYLDHAIYFHHPKYVAHLNCPISIPSILAELILSSVNSSMDTWDQSAGGTIIEQALIDWTSEKIGYGSEADGIFTSGGTQSNLMALLLARNHYCEKRLGHNTKKNGLPADYSKFRFFASEVSHFSIQKSLAILGLGYSSVVSVPCDRNFKMDVLKLEEEIKKCQTMNLIPVGVVATAGTTDFGSIDPLGEISRICRDYDLWMHVDAAYGCGLLVSHKYNGLLESIHQADSVTVDYHKSFFQPVSCSALLVKDKKNLTYVTHHADYLNPLSEVLEGTPNLVNKSIQTTRRFDALKLWLTLRITGHEKIGNAFDQVIDLAGSVFFLFLSDENIELLHSPELSTIVFRFIPEKPCPDSLLDELNTSIRKKMFQSGEAVIAGTKVRGKQYLKMTFLNPETTLADIQVILKMIKLHGHNLYGKCAKLN